ncbi:MAG: DUF885 domain-containing protein [Candidatus Bipolaricaulota bacterium]
MSVNESDRFLDLRKKIFNYEVSNDHILATSLGIHCYDSEWPKVTEESIDSYVKRYGRWKGELEGLDGELLSEEERRSRDVGVHYLDLKSFRLSTLRNWTRVPDAPILVGNGLYPLVRGSDRLDGRRLENGISRISNIPDYLERSKELVSQPDTPLVEFVKDSLAELLELLDSIKEKAARNSNRDVLEDLDHVLEEAKHSLHEYGNWLESRAERMRRTPSFDRGVFQELLEKKKVGYEVDEIVGLGKEYLDRSREVMERYARRVERELSPGDAMRRIETNCPSDLDEALSWYRKSLEEARSYIKKRNILSLSGDEGLKVRTTPGYMQSLEPHGYYTPPMKYDEGSQGTLFVTPERNPEDRKKFSFWRIRNTALRETYPGRHVLQARTNEIDDLFQLLSSSAQTLGGWSIYCENMMRDYGFGDTPESHLIGGKTLRRAAARALIDVKLSTGEFSPEEGVNFLADTTRMSQSTARAEVAEWNLNPGDLLGGLMGYHKIKKLQDDVKWGLGGDYSDRLFHDKFISSGPIPLELIEERMDQFISRHNEQNHA